MNLDTVTVEILRAGPRHNQLLSPLTPYIAICGDAPAGLLTLPAHYEHAAFERRLAELRYEVAAEDPGRTRGVLDETGTELAQILGSINGLAGALPTEPGPRQRLTHLRIVLSASELALLPFEASKVPVGGVGTPADRWLGLSGVCITRHNRAVPTESVRWITAQRPRVLFVGGPGVEGLFEAHRRALWDALRPWSEEPERDDRPDGAWLQVIESATLADIEEAMRRRPSHVHILAHGAEDLEDQYRRFGVALDDATVTGEQLASALTDFESDEFLPTVVTLATCNSADGGSVVPPHASVAHALHEKGIPLVVASQFPLTYQGSLPFVELFYAHQLWGDHPLATLYEIRKKLFNHSAGRHDWASLTVYEALPHDLAEDLDELRYWQARRAHEAALQHLEAAIPGLTGTGADAAPGAEELRKRHAALIAAVGEMERKLPGDGAFASESDGLRAAGWKRIAEADWRLANSIGDDDLFGDSIEHLVRALRIYEAMAARFLGSDDDVVQKKANLHWALTQVLSLRLIVENEFDQATWITARLSANTDLQHSSAPGRAWARVSLLELALLRLADDSADAGTIAEASAAARDHAQRIVDGVGLEAEHVTTTRRQVLRYMNWYGDPEFDAALRGSGLGSREHWGRSGGLLETAAAVVEIFGGVPEEPDPDGGSIAGVPAEEDRSPSLDARPASMTTRAAEGVFEIEMLPAGNGDALWIEYGDPDRPHRLLIDCGRKDTAKHLIERVNALGSPHFELFVMTHIDADHIEGAIPFLSYPGLGATFGDIWFNGWKQVSQFLSVSQAEQFSELLSDAERNLPWNRSVTGSEGEVPAPIVLPEAEPLPTFTLDGGMTLTLLSPTASQLNDLASKWKLALRDLDPEAMLGRGRRPPEPIEDLSSLQLEPLAEKGFRSDRSTPNASSIAFLAEYGGRSALLTGDAHAGVLANSIKALLEQRGLDEPKLSVDAVKMSHHGSANNVSKSLLNVLESPRYLVSTNGAGFYHPDREAIARAILWGGEDPTLHFNYATDLNRMWGAPELTARYDYEAVFPAEGGEGLRVSL